jgi:regulator of protease activity HflC (stomatin/prohibitin superfamily)
MGPESFEMIWKNIAFDRAMTAQQQHAAQQAAATAQRQAAGANAQQLIGNGGSATRAGTSPAPANAGPMSIAEAYAQAERELGIAP